MEKLKKLRDRIDWIDLQIASLIDERMKAAFQVGSIKRNTSKEISDAAREKDVIGNVESTVQLPILKANISEIYQEIMRQSRIQQHFFRYPNQPFKKIGLIGLGLMGGSIYKGLKMKDPSIEIAILHHGTLDGSPLSQKSLGIQVFGGLDALIAHSELIVIASPISTIVPIAEEIKQLTPKSKKLIVIDIASVKSTITQAFERLSSDHVEFISTHPMTGKEKRGFENSTATLFVNRPWVIVSHPSNTALGVERITEWVQFLGSKAVLLDPETHDRQAALISHLPLILSRMYLDFVSSLDPESINISGPGFQSFTRLGQGNADMEFEITSANWQNIQDQLNSWLEYLIKNKG